MLGALLATACQNFSDKSNEKELSEHDRTLQDKQDAWYQTQYVQDCPPPPYDQNAIDAVLRALNRDSKQAIYGKVNRPGRTTPSVFHLKTRSNPKGKGIIVSAWKDEDNRGFADYHRVRLVWLYLGAKVYPINLSSASEIGVLFGGLPQSIQVETGLEDTYEEGRTMSDQLGIQEHTFERRQSGGNPFPMCY